MRIISVIGKVDSRVIVYPLARALALKGFTGIITDDGAYRRLYPGRAKIGNVNGIDVSIVSDINDETIHSLDKSGIQYDYLIIVSCDYIHPNSDGIVICHGVDRSMLAVEETVEEDDFIIPNRQVDTNDEDTSDKPKSKKFGKAKLSKDEESEISNNDTADNNDIAENNSDESADTMTEHDRIIAEQEKNPDKIVIPDGIPNIEVQVAYASSPKKGILSIFLKEGLMNYVYTCEEQQRIPVNSDKGYMTNIAKIGGAVTGIPANELTILLAKEEGAGSTKKGKK